jgi:hypothetical protein
MVVFHLNNINNPVVYTTDSALISLPDQIVDQNLALFRLLWKVGLGYLLSREQTRVPTVRSCGVSTMEDIRTCRMEVDFIVECLFCAGHYQASIGTSRRYPPPPLVIVCKGTKQG